MKYNRSAFSFLDIAFLGGLDRLKKMFELGAVDEVKKFLKLKINASLPANKILGIEEIKKYLDLGYSVVKKKIGGASLSEDCKRIEAVLKILGPNDRLAVDANGRFDLKTAIDYAKKLSNYNLFWYEEPGDPLDFELHKELGNHYSGSIATGENLFSMQDARNLIRYAGMRKDKDWLQFDCALSYGLVEYLNIIS